MNDQIIQAKWLVRGVFNRHTPDIVSDGAILVRDGIVVGTGDLASMQRLAPHAKLLLYPQHMLLLASSMHTTMWALPPPVRITGRAP